MEWNFDNVQYNGKDLDRVQINGTTVWERKLKFYDYLEGDGEAYIDTNYLPNQDTKIEIKYLVSTYSSTYAVILGCTDEALVDDAKNGLLRIQSLTNINRVGYGNGKGTTISISDYNLENTIYTLRFNKNVVYINDNLIVTIPETTWSANYSMYLFGRNSAHSLSYPWNGSIYYCKIWNNDTLVKDFKPCKYYGKAGLWDAVEGKFYGNANTAGSFTVG